jgi:hypothetical protein
MKNILLWYPLVGALIVLLGKCKVSPTSKWSCVVRGRRSTPSPQLPSWRGEQARLVKTVNLHETLAGVHGKDRRWHAYESGVQSLSTRSPIGHGQ